MMRLHGTAASNFTAKCRIALREKGLADVALVDPPAGGASALNPLGRIPVLEVDGTLLFESEVINEFLEDLVPQPPLLPADPLDRARARLISRFHDLYLEPALRVLYPAAGAAVAPDLLAARLPEVARRFDQLERLLGEPWAAGATFTLADCALAPTMLFASLLMRASDRPLPTAERPRLAAWWTLVRTRPSVRSVLDEQRAALAAAPRPAGQASVPAPGRSAARTRLGVLGWFVGGLLAGTGLTAYCALEAARRVVEKTWHVH